MLLVAQRSWSPIVLKLLYLFFHVEGVFGRGGKGASNFARASDLGLSPELYAVFALAIAIATITAFQLQRSLKRFKRVQLPEGEPTLPYDVGTLFRVLLVSFTTVYMVNYILYAIYTASRGDAFDLDRAFYFGVSFTGQLSVALFYATFLSIIAYRQRIQLNPREKFFNLKSLLDGMLLGIILILGIAQDFIARNVVSFDDALAIDNLSIAYEVFSFLASLDVMLSSFMARFRLSKAGIHDKIINISTFAVSPIVVIGGIYGIINVGVRMNAGLSFNYHALLLAYMVMDGAVSIAAITCAILMGAPPKPPKPGKEGGVVEKKV